MSFLLNLKNGLTHLLALGNEVYRFKVQISGDIRTGVPGFLGTFQATPLFLREFRELCEKHQCGVHRHINDDLPPPRW